MLLLSYTGALQETCSDKARHMSILVVLCAHKWCSRSKKYSHMFTNEQEEVGTPLPFSVLTRLAPWNGDQIKDYHSSLENDSETSSMKLI